VPLGEEEIAVVDVDVDDSVVVVTAESGVEVMGEHEDVSSSAVVASFASVLVVETSDLLGSSSSVDEKEGEEEATTDPPTEVVVVVDVSSMLDSVVFVLSADAKGEIEEGDGATSFVEGLDSVVVIIIHFHYQHPPKTSSPLFSSLLTLLSLFFRPTSMFAPHSLSLSCFF